MLDPDLGEGRQTNARPEAVPREEQPFRFLDLPKDIRLMVYEYFIDRDHHKITVREEGESVEITLIMPSPIPHISLVCKELHAEATPFLQKAVVDLGVSRTAPRMIVDGSGHLGDLAATAVEMIIRTMSLELRHFTEKSKLSYWKRYFEEHPYYRHIRKQLESLDYQPYVATFCKNAVQHLHKVCKKRRGWFDEAKEELQLAEVSSGKEWNQIGGLSRKLADAPDAKYTALQILVLGSQTDDLDRYEFQCSIWGFVDNLYMIRVQMNTFNCAELERMEGCVRFWTNFGDVLDDETWRKEWM